MVRALRRARRVNALSVLRENEPDWLELVFVVPVERGDLIAQGRRLLDL
jgi:hypothetical protein